MAADHTLGRESMVSWPSDAATEGELLPALGLGEGARGKALAVGIARAGPAEPPPAGLPSEALLTPPAGLPLCSGI